MDDEPTKKTRRRLSPQERTGRPSLEVRVSQRVKELEDQAWQMPPGPGRDELIRRARRMEVANQTNEWLASPGLKPPF